MSDSRRRTALLLLAGVCVISGSLWLLPEIELSTSAMVGILGVSCALPATLAGARLLERRREAAGSGGIWPLLWSAIDLEVWPWRLMLRGIGAIGAPSLLLLLGRQHFLIAMGVAAEAFVPVVVAITVSAGDEAVEPLQAQLLPALIALGGALLVLPVGLPGSASGWSGFALYLLAACLAGLCGVGAKRALHQWPPLAGFSVVLAANTLFFFAAAAVLWFVQPGLGQGTTPPLLMMILPTVGGALSVSGVVLLLARAEPLATASRFLFVPLLTAVEGYLLLKPTLSWRTVIGAALMLAGALACLRETPRRRVSGVMSLR